MWIEQSGKDEYLQDAASNRGPRGEAPLPPPICKARTDNHPHPFIGFAHVS